MERPGIPAALKKECANRKFYRKNRKMAKKQFKIRARLVFSGQVTVTAHSRQEAEAIVEKDISGQLGKVEVQPEAEERIQDWDFSLKGEAVVNRKQTEEGE